MDHGRRNSLAARNQFYPANLNITYIVGIQLQHTVTWIMSHCQGYTCKTIIDDGISCSKISCTYKQNRIESDSSFFCGWTNLGCCDNSKSLPKCYLLRDRNSKNRSPIFRSRANLKINMKRSNHKVYISIKFPIKGLKCFIHEWASDSHFTCAKSVW